MNRPNAIAIKALDDLASWVARWVGKMHQDIPDEERGEIADEMCCDWSNSGFGASIKGTLRDLDPTGDFIKRRD